MKISQPENLQSAASDIPSCCGGKPAPVQVQIPVKTVPSCCAVPAPKTTPSCCDTGETAKPRTDFMFWGGLLIVAAGYFAYFALGADPHAAHGGTAGAMGMAQRFSAAVFELMNMMWIGVVAGILAMGFLSRVPRDFVMAALGSGRGVQGIVRAAFAGVLLDLCSHGILMVGAKFYERGATVGQVMAFLISSPWNSFSLT